VNRNVRARRFTEVPAVQGLGLRLLQSAPVSCITHRTASLLSTVAITQYGRLADGPGDPNTLDGNQVMVFC
jgi:hypothetical protein